MTSTKVSQVLLGYSGICVAMNTLAHMLPALRQEAAAIAELVGA